MRITTNIVAALLLLICSGMAAAGPIDRAKFLEACRPTMANVLSGDRAEAVGEIIGSWEAKGYEDRRALAYVLGTALRESAGTLRPVREGLCKTDQCAIAAVTKLFEAKGISGNYATPDKDGRSYFGRGYVQLTHARNYKKLGEALGWGNALLEDPGLALDHRKSIEILVEGMVRGLFTSRTLGDYFSASAEDWVGARKIVDPGSKRAEVTARLGQAFYACLRDA